MQLQCAWIHTFIYICIWYIYTHMHIHTLQYKIHIYTIMPMYIYNNLYIITYVHRITCVFNRERECVFNRERERYAQTATDKQAHMISATNHFLFFEIFFQPFSPAPFIGVRADSDKRETAGDASNLSHEPLRPHQVVHRGNAARLVHHFCIFCIVCSISKWLCQVWLRTGHAPIGH